MRSGFRAIALGVNLLCGLPHAGAATLDHEETKVEGKLPVDLGGAWLLLIHMQLPGGKGWKTSLELVRAARSKEGVQLHLLDVRMPKDIQEPLRAANDQFTPWEPSPKQLAALSREWASLPPATDKDVRRGDVAYAQVQFTLATPERYAEVFPRQDGVVKDVLAQSAFGMQIVESYRALPVPPGENISQVLQRKAIYGARGVSANLIEGKQVTGFLAAGYVGPIPIDVQGTFRMYRLAAAAGSRSAPSPTPRPSRAPRGRPGA